MIDIVGQVDLAKERKIKMWPCRSNRASEMGHPCERYLVYLRTHGNERLPHDLGLQYIFDEGNLHEEAVLNDLRKAGLKVIEQQRAFEWPEYQITGHIDGKVVEEEIVLPIEIKSMNPYIWQTIDSLNDLLDSKFFWCRKYPAQMYLYLLMDNKEQGAFILKNKTTGRLKQIDVQLDFEYAESLLKKAENINKHIASNTLPEGIELDENTCGRCSFNHVCLPDRDFGDELKLSNDPVLLERLERRESLSAAYKEYQVVDKEVKGKLKEQPNLLVGDFHITGKLIQRSGYEVKNSEYWKPNIVRIKK